MANLIKNPGMIVNSKKFKQLVDRSITTVTAEDLAGATSIGSWVFYNCKNLTSITIPNSVTSIGSYAIRDCSSLTSIAIPNSVTSIESYGIYYCQQLTRVTIGNGITHIGEFAFGYCISLTNITIHATTPPTLDNANAFLNTNCPIYVPVQSLNAYKTATNWSSLASRIQPIPSEGLSFTVENNEATLTGIGTCTDTNIVIPNSYEGNPVTAIADSAFKNNETITSVVIPDSVTSIGNSAFLGCTNLTTITIPDSVTSIGLSAFYSCYGLTSITIGNGVTDIGYQVFYDCRSLTSITIPDSVTNVGERAFYDCRSLTSITILATIPPALSNINAFDNTNNCPIYVPAESVTSYQGATNWDSLASRIQAIPTT